MRAAKYRVLRAMDTSRVPGSSLRPLHLAGGWQDRVFRLDDADGLPTPTSALFVEFRAGIQRAEAGDIHVFEYLMIVLAHCRVAAIESFDGHSLEFLGNGLWII